MGETMTRLEILAAALEKQYSATSHSSAHVIDGHVRLVVGRSVVTLSESEASKMLTDIQVANYAARRLQPTK